MLNQVISVVDVPIFLVKLALAIWVAIALINWIDRRATIVSMVVALYLCVAVLSAYLVLQVSPDSLRYALGGSVMAGCVGCLISLRAWVRPNVASANAPQSAEDPGSLSDATTHLLFWCAMVGATTLFISVYMAALQLQQADEVLDTRALLHSFCTSGMWGVSLAVAIELTILSTPADFKTEVHTDPTDHEDQPGQEISSPKRTSKTAANWSHAAWVALALLLVEVMLCGSLVLLPQQNVGSPLVPQMFAWMFAMSVLVVQFVGWMIPHRLHNFQKAGEVKEWTTLMLSAWIAFLALAVTAALPVHWPWTML